MSVSIGPKVRKKDLCCVVDARNPLIHNGSTTTITNIIEKQNNLTGTGISTVDDDTAGLSFSFVDANAASQGSWTPVINKYNFTIIYWIKYQDGKDNNYTRLWKTNTTDNPSFGYYWGADTRLPGNEYIHVYVKDYTTNNWDARNVISEADWEGSSTWFQLACVVSAENKSEHYRNGVLINTGTTPNQDLSSYGNIDTIQLGSTYSTTGARCGYFSVYRDALTAADILENYNTLKGRFGL